MARRKLFGAVPLVLLTALLLVGVPTAAHASGSTFSVSSVGDGSDINPARSAATTSSCYDLLGRLFPGAAGQMSLATTCRNGLTGQRKAMSGPGSTFELRG